MIGKKIKEIRNALKKNQENFASPLDVTHSAISQIENGKVTPSKKLLKAICSTYNVNQKWLETGRGPMFNDAVGGLERFSPAQKLLIERFTGYFAEKVPVPETEEVIEVVHGLIDILMSDNEEIKKAIASSILAFKKTLDAGEDKKQANIKHPKSKLNPRSHTKKTKTG